MVEVAVPPGVVTTMLTVPLPAGVTTLNCVEPIYVKDVTAFPPNVTEESVVNSAPLITIDVPPAVGPPSVLR